jgi:hypothetical protein
MYYGISNLKNFERKLRENTGKASVFSFITPKTFNGKDFNGKFNKKVFILSLNTHFSVLNMFKIKGTYIKDYQDDAYKIAYEIDIPKYIKILQLLVFILSFLGINFLIPELAKFPSISTLNINIAYISFLLVAFLIYKLSFRKVKNRFMRVFEIINEPIK